MVKNILIHAVTGLGNKIFDSIIGIYLKQTYGYNIIYTLSINLHSPDSANINILFDELNKYFQFVSHKKGKELNTEYKRITIPKNVKLNEIEKYIIYDNVALDIYSLYDLIFEMYDLISPHIFNFNMKMINNDIQNISKGHYGAIHIRYGDKLRLAYKNGKMSMNYPIYHPYFYFKQLTFMKKLNLPILIFTDSPSIVKKFILKKYGFDRDKKIYLMNISPLQSIYLLSRSAYFVMSPSTFSYVAYLFGKSIGKFKKIVIADFVDVHKYDIYDNIIKLKDWLVLYDKKFILNFDVSLVKHMQKAMKSYYE
jgi:hypothetical protein